MKMPGLQHLLKTGHFYIHRLKILRFRQRGLDGRCRPISFGKTACLG